jgi:YggT family protein
MKSLFILIDNLFQIYLWVVIINAVVNWLVVFNVINTSNSFVRSLIEISYTLTEPPLRIIRKVLPVIGSIDFSPVVLVLGLLFLRNIIFEFFALHLF